MFIINILLMINSLLIIISIIIVHFPFLKNVLIKFNEQQWSNRSIMQPRHWTTTTTTTKSDM